ncbi:hypothetical protein [Streptomyces sp. NPDC054834]
MPAELVVWLLLVGCPTCCFLREAGVLLSAAPFSDELLIIDASLAAPEELLTKVVGLTWPEVGFVHEDAGWRDAVSRVIARDKPGDVGEHPRDTGRPWMRSKSSSPIPSARLCASATCS